MTDPATGLPADSLDADGTRACRRRPRTSARTCGARWSPSGSGSSATARRSRRLKATLARSRHGTPPAERPVLQLVRPHDRRQADRLAADRRAADADPVVGRQRLAGDRAPRRREQRPELSSARRRALRQHGFRLLLPAGGQPDPFHYAPDTGGRRAATTRSSARAGSRATSGSRPASCRRRSTSGPGGRSRRHATGTGRRSKPVGFHRTYLGVDVFEGAYNTTARGSSRAGAAACSRRSCPRCSSPRSNGAAQLGGQPPADGRAQIHHGLVEAGYGYWGFSPRTCPKAATRSTASTRSG